MLLVAAMLPSSAAAVPEPADVVVVGAGLSGLVAAYVARKRGLSTQVLEAQATVGCRMASATYPGGLIAEYGTQEIWAGSPLLDIARELGVPRVIKHQHCSHSSFLHNGRIYRAPETMREQWVQTLPMTDVTLLERFLAEAKSLREVALKTGLADPRIRALQGQSLADWLDGTALGELAGTWLTLHLEVELGSRAMHVSAVSAPRDGLPLRRRPTLLRDGGRPLASGRRAGACRRGNHDRCKGRQYRVAEAFKADSRPGDIATQPLEPLALMRLAALVDVRLVVLAMVMLDRFHRQDRLERVRRVGQFGKLNFDQYLFTSLLLLTGG